MQPSEGLPGPVLTELVRAYDLGAIRRVEHLPQGRVNDNYDVSAGSGRYVIRQSRESRTVEAVAFEHGLMEHLGARGFPVPPLLRTSAGATYHVVDGAVYRVTRFVEGEKFNPDRRAHLEAVARSLARYHQLVREYDAPERKQGFRPVLTTLWDGLSRLPWPDTDPEALTGASPEVRGYLTDLHRWLRATHARLLDSVTLGIPRLVVYGSCRKGSFIFRGDQVAAMLDYDNAYPDVRTLDVAIALLDFAAVQPDKVRLDPAASRAFLAAYQGVEPMPAHELALVPWYVRARILKRELVRYEHYLTRPKAKREDKLHRAAARLAVLEVNERQLVGAVSA